MYHNENILKLRDFISLQNALLIKDYFDNELPCAFNGYFNKTKWLTLTEHDAPQKIVSLSKRSTLSPMAKFNLILQNLILQKPETTYKTHLISTS